jgi:cellulose synthase/poly-beta-1,6-N-acetylglucosamine synthase-like glycosyltransferase
MVLDVLRQLTHAALLAALALLCVLCATLAWHVITFLRLRRSGLAREAALLTHALPTDAGLPDVLVQLPTFNEGSVIRRVTQAVGRLDWPSEKLHIQVLDDSSDDGAAAAAREAVEALRGRGLDAVLLHRSERTGFKAAALQAGLRLAHHDYVAVFDADFVPPADFLRKCVRVLLADPRLAFAQARFDAMNGRENALTRAQEFLMDVFFAVLQAPRGWSGHSVIFSGTCALWRRSALDELGGWQSDIFMEDIDLSYRAFLGGWAGWCLLTVAVPGELPASTASFQVQQYRWNGGLAQAMRKYLPEIWRSPLPLGHKLLAATYLGYSAFGALLGIAAVAMLLEFLLGWGPRPWAWALAAVGSVAFAVSMLGLPLSRRLLRGANPWSDLPEAVLSILVLVYTQFAVAFSFRHMLGVKGPSWRRTPKKGSPLTPEDPEIPSAPEPRGS